MHQYKVNAKAAFDGDIWQWHQDYGTWARDDGMPEPRAMNISVFLDEVMPINGPLMFIPGSHKSGVLPAGHDEATTSYPLWTLDHATITRLVDGRGIVAPTGKPGAVLMFHGNLVHASTANITPYPRKIVYLTLCAVSNHIRTPTRPEWIAHRDFTPIVPVADDALLPIRPLAPDGGGIGRQPMALKRMVLQIGMGTDIRGRDYTKAAVRALRDALWHNSLPRRGALGLPVDAMQVEVTDRRAAPRAGRQGGGAGGAAARHRHRQRRRGRPRDRQRRGHQHDVLANAAAVVRLDLPEGALAMTLKRVITEFGSGNDLHGGDYTKAAVRAVAGRDPPQLAQPHPQPRRSMRAPCRSRSRSGCSAPTGSRPRRSRPRCRTARSRCGSSRAASMSRTTPPAMSRSSPAPR